MSKTKSKNNLLANKSLLTIFLVTILLIVLGFTGIFYFAKSTNKQIQEVKVDYKESATLPQKFPADFPIYPNAKITSSWTNEDDQSTGVSVVWETGDGLSKINEFYKVELLKNNWKITNEFSTDSTSTISFEKQKYNGFIGISSKDKLSVISVTVGVEK